MGHNMNRTLWAWEREGWFAHALGKGWMGPKVRVKRVGVAILVSRRARLTVPTRFQLERWVAPLEECMHTLGDSVLRLFRAVL